MFVVAGATGNVGGALTRALADRGESVRAITRRPDAALPPGVEAVQADLDDPASMAPALAGAIGVFLLSGYADMPGLLAEVTRADVRRVVLLSGSSVEDGDLDNAVAEYQIRSEQAVRDSGVAATFLRPSAFMTNALPWIGPVRAGEPVRLQFPQVAAAVIDPRDIAEVAAVALVRGDLEGPLRLTGSEALLPAERLRILGEVLDLPVTGVPLSDAETIAELRATMPERYVQAFTRFYVDGDLDESLVIPTVREVLGREPRTFREWAVDSV
jgi:uncharacterized protein YbjT (DUF2867 family)